MENYQEYFSGKKLYGEDFSEGEIKEWLREEKEAYADIESENLKEYEYHALNIFHGYSKLREIFFNNVLCFGGGNGKEILPIINNVKKINIIEPSKKYRTKELNGKKLNYLSVSLKGKIKARDETFDLITCFGVLHHLPNVSFIINEFKRVLKPEGYLLLREPTVSMGDWRKKRKGITKRERGIPLHIFRKIILKEGFDVLSCHRVTHPFSRRGFYLFKRPFNSKSIVLLDYVLGLIFSFNKKYHATKFYHKLQPQSVFYVLRKNKLKNK